MTAINTPANESTEKKTPLVGWQRWLEFLQIVAVLVIGCGIAIPFVTGFDPGWSWIGVPTGIVVGSVLAFTASRLVKPAPVEIKDGQQFEITRTRLRTLASNDTPRDVLWALREMCDPKTKQWRGSEGEFRQSFYEKIGEKRGAQYASSLLLFLAVYVAVQAQSTKDVSTESQPAGTKLLERATDASAAETKASATAPPPKVPLGDMAS
ncbi:MAG TPA: hypothetical protein VJZ76_10660 [Thermoanaerobaculia bacterium]|nr:hypothetical protein [Thermoanaerobaculia bacterium]